MLVSKFGQLTAKLATKPSKAAAITKRKYSIRKPHVAEYAKTRPLSLYRTFRRSVSTLGDNIEEDVTHVRDLRGQTDAVQFLDGLPPSQAHRKVLIYKPTPKTVQQGTRVRTDLHFTPYIITPTTIKKLTRAFLRVFVFLSLLSPSSSTLKST